MKTSSSHSAVCVAFVIFMCVFLLHVLFKSSISSSVSETLRVVPVSKTSHFEPLYVEQITPMISLHRQAKNELTQEYLLFHGTHVATSLLPDSMPDLTYHASQEHFKLDVSKMHQYCLQMHRALIRMPSQKNPRIVSRIQEAATHFMGRLSVCAVELNEHDTFLFTNGTEDYPNVPGVVFTNCHTWNIVRNNHAHSDVPPIFYLVTEKKIMISHLEHMPGTLYEIFFASALYDGFLQETSRVEKVQSRRVEEYDRVAGIRLEVADCFTGGKYREALQNILVHHDNETAISLSFADLRILDTALFVKDPQGLEIAQLLLNIHINSLALVAKENESQKSGKATLVKDSR